MTKEELEKEALEKYKTGSYPQIHPDHYAFIHGYLAGAEPREKRIAELEQKLEQTEKDLTDYQFNYPKILDLEKENAELKNKNKNADSLNNKLEEDNYNLTCNLNATLDRLNEATELLKAFKDCKRVNTTTISDAPLMEREQLEQTEEMKNKCSTLLDKLYLSGLKPNQVALVERMQDVLGV